MNNKLEKIVTGFITTAFMASLIIAGVAAAQSVICEEEDSLNCVWVGPLQGNGQGAIVINGSN